MRCVGLVAYPGSAHDYAMLRARPPRHALCLPRVVAPVSDVWALGLIHGHRTLCYGSGGTSAGLRRRRGCHWRVSRRVPMSKQPLIDDRTIATVSLLIFLSRPFRPCGRGARVRFCPPRVGVEGRGWVLWRPTHPQSMYGADASNGSGRGSARGSEW